MVCHLLLCRVWGSWRYRLWQKTAAPVGNPRFQCCPTDRRFYDAAEGHLEQLQNGNSKTTKQPRWQHSYTCICLCNHTIEELQLETWRTTCSSVLPLTGCSAEVWETLDFRKPPATTIKTHTARRCCLLLLFIILSLFSEREHQRGRLQLESISIGPLFICMVICSASLIIVPTVLPKGFGRLDDNI